LQKAYITVPARKVYQRRYYAAVSLARVQRSEVPQTPTNSGGFLETELARAAEIIHGSTAPSEAAIYDALQICEHLARSLPGAAKPLNGRRRSDKTPTSNLLSLDDRVAATSPAKETMRISVQDRIRDRIASTAYRIVADPKTFITPNTLSLYVVTQAMLHRPKSFPQVFDLYASKPVPKAGSSPITYSDPSPNSPKAAVPLHIAKTALDAALEAKDLPLCLNIITTTVATSAFKRAKFLRKALLPSVALALSPLAAYALGKAFAESQERLDQQVGTIMATACFMTYFGMTAMTGYGAITTANDHMDRVTWLVGTALYKRWFREEERAFTDRVAQAWGFQDYLKRGQEEGEDWENLREWIMGRSMVLDNPELMEGME
ncbi:MAG: hypothetical protein Q9163_001189, partial [Psora crenata]